MNFEWLRKGDLVRVRLVFETRVPEQERYLSNRAKVDVHIRLHSVIMLERASRIVPGVPLKEHYDEEAPVAPLI